QGQGSRPLFWAKLVQVLATAVFLVGGITPALAEDPSLPAGFTAALKGHSDTVYTVAFSPDGKYVVTGSFHKTLKVCAVPTRQELKTYDGPQGHQQQVLAAVFSPDGRYIASGGSDNTAKIWDTPLGELFRPITHFGNITIFPTSFGKNVRLGKPGAAG